MARRSAFAMFEFFFIGRAYRTWQCTFYLPVLCSQFLTISFANAWILPCEATDLMSTFTPTFCLAEHLLDQRGRRHVDSRVGKDAAPKTQDYKALGWECNGIWIADGAIPTLFGVTTVLDTS